MSINLNCRNQVDLKWVLNDMNANSQLTVSLQKNMEEKALQEYLFTANQVGVSAN